MPNLDVDSDALRAAGKDVAGRRDELDGETDLAQLPLLDVMTQSQMAISTGGFVPGALAMQRLLELYPKAVNATLTVRENLTGLSSGLHIVADVYDEGEYEQALAFAFQGPDGDVERPSGLPDHIQPGNGLEDYEDYYEAGEEPYDGEVPEDGRTVTEVIGGEDPTHPPYQVTRVYDGDDNVVASHYVVQNPDGSTTYYTEFPREGGSERVNEVTVDAQSPHASSDEYLDRRLDNLQEPIDDLEEQLEEYGMGKD